MSSLAAIFGFLTDDWPCFGFSDDWPCFDFAGCVDFEPTEDFEQDEATAGDDAASAAAGRAAALFGAKDNAPAAKEAGTEPFVVFLPP
jgi:hypothetical protein